LIFQWSDEINTLQIRIVPWTNYFFGATSVVGVVRNTVVNAIGEEPPPLAYLPMTQDYSPAVTMQVRTSGAPKP
jgi:hypothetical protein